MKRLFIFIFLFGTSFVCFTQVAADYAVLVTASTDETVPSITLSWPHDSLATGYIVYKKSKGSVAWTETLATLPGDDSTFTDTNVVTDSAYEYQVEKSTAMLTAYGYIYSGMKVHPAENRGKLILLVDSAFRDSLSAELLRLMKDISGDGWAIARHDVSRNASVTDVKSIISDEYDADPDHVKCIFIFGHVPVPYSGDLNPDGHPDHLGAWPADIFYGDLNGNFTDIYVNDPGAARPENKNIPGDGKYDQSLIPGVVDLECGRVDLANLPAFSLSEGELLRRYLDKDHAFRNKLFTAVPRGLIDDNFGAFNGEAFASSGWRNFSPLVGSSAISELDFFTTLGQESYLWSYGCGGGWFQGAGGVGSTADFAADTVKSVFTMLFGSYFGDWDSQDNFLRAPLASAGYALTCCWAGRPHWQFHHMGMGENIGYSAKLTQNNNSTYYYNYGRHFVHIALMGDPTLRMHVTAPVPGVEATTLHSTATINWQASPDPVPGYYIYRSGEEFGEYSRISSSIVTGLTFNDPDPLAGTNYYMVRALQLVQSPSGTYYNLSTGITDSVSVVLGTAKPGPSRKSIFSVYPNPATSRLFLKTEAEFKGPVHVEIADIAGKTAMTEDYPYMQRNIPVLLTLQGLRPGVYLLIISASGNREVQRIEVLGN